MFSLFKTQKGKKERKRKKKSNIHTESGKHSSKIPIKWEPAWERAINWESLQFVRLCSRKKKKNISPARVFRV